VRGRPGAHASRPTLGAEILNDRYALPVTMPVCPARDADVTEWANRIEKAPAASAPKVWTCPECDVVLGVSDRGVE